MGTKVVTRTPMISDRALLEFRNVEVRDSRFREDDGREQAAFFCTFVALGGVGGRKGETFSEFVNIPLDENGDLQLEDWRKAGQIVLYALNGDVDEDDDAATLAEKLVGRRIIGGITTSEDGQYSRVKPKTIEPYRPKPEPEPEPDDPDDDFSDIPW